jgi:OOP family OmpA-OmpF porin
MDKRLIGIIMTSVFSAGAMAQEPGFYVGGSLGYANLDQDEAEMQSILTNAGLTGTVDIDDEDLGWKFFGGYNFNQYFGAEIGYVNLGSVDTAFNVTAPAAATGSASVDVDGFTASGTLSYPINEQLDVFGKLGVLVWNADGSASVSGVTVSADDDDTDVHFGIGGKYHHTENITFRAEWERAFDVGGSDLDLFSVGVQYNFNLP